jgi:hypothetical protein
MELLKVTLYNIFNYNNNNNILIRVMGNKNILFLKMLNSGPKWDM